MEKEGKGDSGNLREKISRNQLLPQSGRPPSSARAAWPTCLSISAASKAVNAQRPATTTHKGQGKARRIFNCSTLGRQTHSLAFKNNRPAFYWHLPSKKYSPGGRRWYRQGSGHMLEIKSLGPVLSPLSPSPARNVLGAQSHELSPEHFQVWSKSQTQFKKEKLVYSPCGFAFFFFLLSFLWQRHSKQTHFTCIFFP